MDRNSSPHYISTTFAPLLFKYNCICQIVIGFTAWSQGSIRLHWEGKYISKNSVKINKLFAYPLNNFIDDAGMHVAIWNAFSYNWVQKSYSQLGYLWYTGFRLEELDVSLECCIIHQNDLFTSVIGFRLSVRSAVTRFSRFPLVGNMRSSHK